MILRLSRLLGGAKLQSSAESNVQDAAVASLVSGSPIEILPESLVNALAQDRLQS